ncbi:unnamed protein product, partial [marine sediment metagenome]
AYIKELKPFGCIHLACQQYLNMLREVGAWS